MTEYPIYIAPHLYQYGDGVFVWFDEAGIASGAASTIVEAQRQLFRYFESLGPVDDCN